MGRLSNKGSASSFHTSLSSITISTISNILFLISCHDQKSIYRLYLNPVSVAASSREFASTRAVWKNQRWRRVAHAPSKRHGIDQSKIWDHGTDYECNEEANLHARRYSHCFKDYLIPMKQDTTSNARRHLRVSHSVHLDSVPTLKRSRGEYEAEDEVAKSPQVKAIMTVVNIDTFRYYLTRLGCDSSHLFREVEDSDFQEMLEVIEQIRQRLSCTLVAHIRHWTENDFIEAKKLIHEEVIVRAISKIHISCDL